MAEYDLTPKGAALLSRCISIGLGIVQDNPIERGSSVREVKKIATVLSKLSREEDDRPICLELPDPD